ncbi:MAG: hypothetical protein ABL970_17815 [Nitrospira sp.]
MLPVEETEGGDEGGVAGGGVPNGGVTTGADGCRSVAKPGVCWMSRAIEAERLVDVGPELAAAVD